MKLTDDTTRCDSIPAWARALEAQGGAWVASFGHAVISEVAWGGEQSFLPLHDVLRFEFAEEEAGAEAPADEADLHFATNYGVGLRPTGDGETARLPSLIVRIDRDHFQAVLADHFAERAGLAVRPTTFLRATIHGRGLYALADSLRRMVRDRTDLFSRYCLEIALIKAIALAPPNMLDLHYKGPTWGPAMRRVDLAAAYMIQDLERPFDLQEIANAASCSIRSLTEAFQTYVALSPAKFHRQCRLEAAYAALARGNASVTEVANQFGFENLGRFARAFEERFGHKPSKIPKL